MSIAHEDNNLVIQSGFICVLTEALDYETPQHAYEAYRLASLNSDKSLSDLDIKLSGLWLPRDIATCRQLVDEIDFQVSLIGLGIDYFLEVIQGKHKLLIKPDFDSLCLRTISIEEKLNHQNECPDDK